MSNTAIVWPGHRGEPATGMELTELLTELDQLQRENRRLAVSLGAFSAFIASKGLLEEAWSYVNSVHQLEDG